MIVRQEVLKGLAAGFLFTLDENGDSKVNLLSKSLERLQRVDMGNDSGLVIRCTAAKKPVPLERCLEWLRLPKRAVSWRLDVVVGIKQDVGRAIGCSFTSQNRRRPKFSIWLL